MTSPTFNPRERVAEIGTRATAVVMEAANGQPWTPATLYAAAESLRSARPRLAKRLHDLGAQWAVLHKTVRA